jgi:hypothetical protein
VQKNFKVELIPIAKRIGIKGSIPRRLRRMKNNFQGYPAACGGEHHSMRLKFFKRSAEKFQSRIDPDSEAYRDQRVNSPPLAANEK